MNPVLKVSFAPDSMQLLIVVPKRVVPKAHDRNRFKRVIREYFRLHKGMIKAGKWVVIAKQNAAHLTNEEIRSSLAKQIAKQE